MRDIRSNFREYVVQAFQGDLEAWRERGWAAGPGVVSASKMVLSSNGLRATLVYRLGRWASVSGLPVLPRVFEQLNVALHGIELYSWTDIRPGLFMPHTVGSVVGATRIGSGVTLQAGITVGTREGNDLPEIEDGVFVSTGCRIIGPIRIGAGSVIGANAVVVHDVPAGVTAVGVPARILRSEDT